MESWDILSDALDAAALLDLTCGLMTWREGSWFFEKSLNLSAFRAWGVALSNEPMERDVGLPMDAFVEGLVSIASVKGPDEAHRVAVRVLGQTVHLAALCSALGRRPICDRRADLSIRSF